jgi:hypothetical protein
MNPWLIAPIAATVAVALDCFTTYRGVFVKKTGTEGDMFWFTQWAAAKPWHLLVPPMIPASLIACQALISNSWATMVIAGVSIGVAAKSVPAIVHNLKVNGGF